MLILEKVLEVLNIVSEIQTYQKGFEGGRIEEDIGHALATSHDQSISAADELCIVVAFTMLRAGSAAGESLTIVSHGSLVIPVALMDISQDALLESRELRWAIPYLALEASRDSPVSNSCHSQ